MWKFIAPDICLEQPGTFGYMKNTVRLEPLFFRSIQTNEIGTATLLQTAVGRLEDGIFIDPLMSAYGYKEPKSGGLNSGRFMTYSGHNLKRMNKTLAVGVKLFIIRALVKNT